MFGRFFLNFFLLVLIVNHLHFKENNFSKKERRCFFNLILFRILVLQLKKEKKLTMDMRVFQIESGRVLPMKGDILISSPFFSWS